MTNKSLYLFNPKRIWARRISVFGLMLISTFLAGVKWTMSLPTDAALWLRILMIGLFILTFAWISLFSGPAFSGLSNCCVSSCAGNRMGAGTYAFDAAGCFADAGL